MKKNVLVLTDPYARNYPLVLLLHLGFLIFHDLVVRMTKNALSYPKLQNFHNLVVRMTKNDLLPEITKNFHNLVVRMTKNALSYAKLQKILNLVVRMTKNAFEKSYQKLQNFDLKFHIKSALGPRCLLVFVFCNVSFPAKKTDSYLTNK